jgi:hypothetical protein
MVDISGYLSLHFWEEVFVSVDSNDHDKRKKLGKEDPITNSNIHLHNKDKCFAKHAMLLFRGFKLYIDPILVRTV